MEMSWRPIIKGSVNILMIVADGTFGKKSHNYLLCKIKFHPIPCDIAISLLYFFCTTLPHDPASACAMYVTLIAITFRTFGLGQAFWIKH